MIFEQVLPALREGKIAQRKGWNGKGMWIAVQYPDENSKMQLPYFYICTTNQNKLVPWVPSNSDILSDDWEVL